MQNITSRQLAALHEIGGTPFPLSVVQSLFPQSEPWRVAAQLVRDGVLLRLKRDMFVLSAEMQGHPIDQLSVANRICSPSYVSREAALAHYGMIPERVVNVTCSRLGRSVEFETPVGGFQYESVDRAVYAIGLCEQPCSEGRFLCATPEKALYDLVLFRSGLNIRSRVEMRRFLFEDLRLDVEERVFDSAVFADLIEKGRKRRSIGLMKEVLCHGEI